MAKRQSNRNGSAVAAVAYIRVSDKQQDRSPDSQLGEIERYAKAKGYQLIGEPYCDERVSGWKSDKRLAFKQLRADAES